MKHFLFYSCILISILGAAACECTTKAYGVVVERGSRKPLDEVEISIYLAQQHGDSLSKPILTDRDGKFELTHSYCSDYMLNFHKEGYIDFVRSVPKGDTIFLERIEGQD